METETVKAVHPLCATCGRPVALLFIEGKTVTVEGVATFSALSIVLDLHQCARVKAPAADRADPEHGDPTATARAAYYTALIEARSAPTDPEAEVVRLLSRAYPLGLTTDELRRRTVLKFGADELAKTLLDLVNRGLVWCLRFNRDPKGHVTSVWAMNNAPAPAGMG